MRLGFPPGLLVCAVLLHACTAPPTGTQQPVSLDEARTIAITTQAQGFVAPPRTITDIAAILDQQKPDPARAEAMRRAATAEPPAGTAGPELVRFLIDRAVARGEVGELQK